MAKLNPFLAIKVRNEFIGWEYNEINDKYDKMAIKNKKIKIGSGL